MTKVVQYGAAHTLISGTRYYNHKNNGLSSANMGYRNFGFMRLYRIKNQNYANFDAFHVSAMAYVTDG